MAVVIENESKPSSCWVCRKLNECTFAYLPATNDLPEPPSNCPIKDLEQAIPQPNTGRWVYDGDCIICNRCKKAYDFISIKMATPFCPNCGAKMEESEEKNDKDN